MNDREVLSLDFCLGRWTRLNVQTLILHVSLGPHASSGACLMGKVMFQGGF